MRMATIFGVLVLIGGYYLVATLVFPDEPELWPDFDAYFWQQKHWVVGGMFAINIAVNVATFALGAAGQAEVAPEEAAANPLLIVAFLMLLLNFPAFLWLTFSKGRIVCMVLMLFIIATQLLFAVAAWGVPGLV